MVLESVHEWFFFAPKVGVAEGVETRGMVHLGEVGKLVADDVFTQVKGEENEGAAEGDDTLGRACAESAEATTDAPGTGRHPYPCGHLCGVWEKQSWSKLISEAAEHGADKLLGGGIVK